MVSDYAAAGHALGLGRVDLGSGWVLEKELPLFIIHSKPTDNSTVI